MKPSNGRTNFPDAALGPLYLCAFAPLRERPCVKGFALLTVLLALLILGALGAVSVGLALSEFRMARTVIDVAAVRGLVEHDIARVYESFDVVARAAMRVGSTSVAVSDVGGRVHRREVRRVAEHVFLINATVDEPDGPLLSDGLLAALVPPAIGLERPISSGGPVRLGVDVSLAAVDTELDADCGSASLMAVPPDIGDPTEDLTAWLDRATVVLPVAAAPLVPRPTYSGRECHRADAANWGDPAHPDTDCGLYFPIVRAPGDLVVDGGIGQGTLLVEGDLTMRGGAEFRGLVLVGGTMVTDGAGATVIGAVQIGDPDGRGSDLWGPSRFVYSPCALGRALQQLGHLEPLRQRSWLSIF